MLPIVAISGSQGSGKSLLINNLTNLGYGVVNRKTSRSIMTDWGVTLSEINNNRELTVKFQDEILMRKIADEDNARLSQTIKNRPIITERTFMDLATYACVAIGKDNEYSDWMTNYYISCAKQTQVYSLVFYLTAGHFDIQHDGIRAINPIYSRMVDLTMRNFTESIVEVGKLILIDTSDIQERTKIVNDTIKTYL